MNYGTSHVRFELGTQVRIRTEGFFDIPKAMISSPNPETQERDVVKYRWLFSIYTL